MLQNFLCGNNPAIWLDFNHKKRFAVKNIFVLFARYRVYGFQSVFMPYLN